MAFITPEVWAAHKAAIDGYAEDTAQEVITWKKYTNVIDRYGEDKQNGPLYEDRDLKALVQYNYFRSWPINDATVTGKIDKQSVLIYINTQYIKDKGWTNAHDMLMFDPGKDRFVLDGLWYKTSGETRAAQAHNSALVQLIILVREELSTSTQKFE